MKLELMIEELLSIKECGLKNNIKPTATEIWKPPAFGRLAINVDAAVGKRRCAWALVARNHFGRLVCFATSCGEKSPPQVAETKALFWATEVARTHG